MTQLYIVVGAILAIIVFLGVLEIRDRAKTWWKRVKAESEEYDKARNQMTKDSFAEFNSRYGIDFESKAISDEEWAAEAGQNIAEELHQAAIRHADEKRSTFRGYTNLEHAEGDTGVGLIPKKELARASVEELEPFPLPLPYTFTHGPDITAKDFAAAGERTAKAIVKRFSENPINGFPMVVATGHSGPMNDPKMSIHARNYDHNPNRYQHA